MKISYECEDLINELKQDILEFGEDKELYAFIKEIEGEQIIFNYDFISEDMPLSPSEIDGFVQIMKAKDILKILEEQNKLI